VETAWRELLPNGCASIFVNAPHAEPATLALSRAESSFVVNSAAALVQRDSAPPSSSRAINRFFMVRDGLLEVLDQPVLSDRAITYSLFREGSSYGDSH